MTAVGRLLAFAGVLLVVFVAGYGIGAAVGPEPVIDRGPAPTTVMTDDHQDHEGHEGQGTTP